MIFTVGHSNIPFSRFLELLKEHEIEMVLDVRSKPWSRHNPQFNRRVLESALKEAGIEYRQTGRVFGGLHTVPTSNAEFRAWMAKLVKRGEELNVALMCAEADPKNCHRAMKLTAYLHRLDPPVTAFHILPEGALAHSVIFEKAMPEGWLWTEFGGRNRAVDAQEAVERVAELHEKE